MSKYRPSPCKAFKITPPPAGRSSHFPHRSDIEFWSEATMPDWAHRVLDQRSEFTKKHSKMGDRIFGCIQAHAGFAYGTGVSNFLSLVTLARSNLERENQKIYRTPPVPGLFAGTTIIEYLEWLTKNDSVRADRARRALRNHRRALERAKRKNLIDNHANI